MGHAQKVSVALIHRCNSAAEHIKPLEAMITMI